MLEYGSGEIRIDGLEVYAHHGVYPEEKEQGQTFIVDAVLRLETRGAGLTDELEQTVNYGTVCRFINEWMQEHPCNLLEAAAERLAEQLLLTFSPAESVTLEIHKPQAPIGLPFHSVSVRITRGWHEAYLSLGSNLGDREQYLDDGLAALEQCPRIRVLDYAAYLVTKPYGGVEQGDFLNTAVKIRTFLAPHELLDELHRIESAAGRTREIHWGPRTLDMDILFYDKLVYEDDTLIIPHADLENRYFVLKPLSEIAPNLRHPLTGRTVMQMLKSVES